MTLSSSQETGSFGFLFFNDIQVLSLQNVKLVMESLRLYFGLWLRSFLAIKNSIGSVVRGTDNIILFKKAGSLGFLLL
jgi:hypothetical protein